MSKYPSYGASLPKKSKLLSPSLWILIFGLVLLLVFPIFVFINENVGLQVMAVLSAVLLTNVGLRRSPSRSWEKIVLGIGVALISVGSLFWFLELMGKLPTLLPLKIGPILAGVALLINYADLYIQERASKKVFVRLERDRYIRTCVRLTWVFFFGYGIYFTLVGSDGGAFLFTLLAGWISFLGSEQKKANERSSPR